MLHIYLVQQMNAFGSGRKPNFQITLLSALIHGLDTRSAILGARTSDGYGILGLKLLATARMVTSHKAATTGMHCGVGAAKVLLIPPATNRFLT